MQVHGILHVGAAERAQLAYHCLDVRFVLGNEVASHRVLNAGHFHL
jgi:hypothetical protein